MLGNVFGNHDDQVNAGLKWDTGYSFKRVEIFKESRLRPRQRRHCQVHSSGLVPLEVVPRLTRRCRALLH